MLVPLIVYGPISVRHTQLNPSRPYADRKFQNLRRPRRDEELFEGGQAQRGDAVGGEPAGPHDGAPFQGVADRSQPEAVSADAGRAARVRVVQGAALRVREDVE